VDPSAAWCLVTLLLLLLLLLLELTTQYCHACTVHIFNHVVWLT
jgi:hypothetical protein